MRQPRMFSDLKHDLSHAARMFGSRPALGAIVIGTLMLGIGVSTAVFSIFNAVMISGLPFRDPERLVMLWNVYEKAGFDLKQMRTAGHSFSIAEWRDWKQELQDVFQDVGIFSGNRPRVSKTDDPESVFGYMFGPGLFQLLDVRPMIGRGFTAEDDRVGADLVALLQYDFWKRRYHSDPRAIGQKLYLGNTPYTIVGVMPPNFVFFSRQTDYISNWQVPLQNLEAMRGRRFPRAMARLKPGVSLQQAQARADSLSAQLAQQHPETNRDWHAVLVPMTEESSGELRPAMVVLLAAVICVLLIMCANVANLLLAQASGRTKELAVRSALGAGRSRLIRQLLTESLALAVTGGALGFGLAVGIIRYFQTMQPDRYTHAKYLVQTEAIRLDPMVAAFAIGVTILAGLIFGLAPALMASRPNFNETLKDTTRGATGGRGSRFLRDALVVGEVTGAVVLVVAAALLVRSFMALYDRGPGFRPEHLLSIIVDMAWEDVQEQVQAQRLQGFEAQKLYEAADRNFQQRLYSSLAAIPGLEGVTAATDIPLSGYYVLSPMTIEGRAPAPRGHEPQVINNVVHPNYFELLHLPLIQGRSFGREDGRDAPRTVLVSQELVRRYFSGEDPLGRRIKLGDADSKFPWSVIVGIVGDIREDGMDSPPQPYTYFCDQQMYFTGQIIVRSEGDPMSFLPDLTRAIHNADRKASIYRVMMVEDAVHASTWKLNYSMLLLGSLAAIAVMLAIVGVYGVLSYSVRLKTAEIGVRMALGAGHNQVLGLVLRQGVGLVGLGIIFGLFLAGFLTRFLRTLLFGVGAFDATTFAAVALVLLVVGGLASYLPARRAARMDPVVALRNE